MVLQISEETADLIAVKSIEMWQKHGSPKNVNANNNSNN